MICKGCYCTFEACKNRLFCTKLCRITYESELKKLENSLKIKSKKCATKEEVKISRFKIFERDNFQCVYCGASAHDGTKLHVDHIYPRDLGGQNDVVNLVTCCKECNSSKKNKPFSKEKIIELWKRNEDLAIKNGLLDSYAELKDSFNKIYRL